MLFRLFRRKLAADKSGAAAIEFAFVAIGLVLFTLAIIDVGFALFWFNRAEKATQLGVRVASVSNPVTDFLSTYSGAGPGLGAAGEGCEDPNTGTLAPFCDHDDIICSAPAGTIASLACLDESNNPIGISSSAAFSKIFVEMRTLYPQLSSANLQVEYRPSLAGFAARPGNDGGFNLVPQVTVRIVNLTYNWVALGSLLGLPDLDLPVISASLIGEDLNHTSNL
jgi:Flp pilus assembly pilin Flp